MRQQFDWQTEEDADWIDADEHPDEGTPSRPSWVVVVVIVLALGIAGAAVYRQIDQRVQETTSQVKEEVMAAHALVQSTSERQDADLFFALVSGRDPVWVDTQMALLTAAGLWERSAFGLEIAGAGEDEVTLAPDLRSAVVETTRPYSVAGNETVTETVTLVQTAVYRQGRERWLYSPPEDEFWGQWQSYNGELISLSYPHRDTAVAERLGPDLDRLLADTCSRLDAITCPEDLHVNLRLDSDPESLLTVADVEAMMTAGYRLTLPTPTLVGTPIDEAGYEVLQRGYSRHVVTAVVPQLLEYECCQRGMLFQAILDRQLADLGLKPWPLTTIGYAHLLHQSLSPRQLERTWSPVTTRPQDEAAVYSLIDFLMAANPTATPGAMLAALVENGTFGAWMRQISPYRSAANSEFRSNWLRFVDQQVQSVQAAGPELPDSSIQLICQQGSPDYQTGIFAYEVSDHTWHTPYSLPSNSGNNVFYGLLPAGNGYVRYVRMTNDRYPARTILHFNDQDITLFEMVDDETPQPNWGVTSAADPSGQLIAIVNYRVGATAHDIYLLDLNHCSTGGCDLLPVIGWPTWSPNGEQTLLLAQLEAGFSRTLFRGDARGQAVAEIGRGSLPFWLDNAHYGYVRTQDRHLVIGSVGDGGDETLLALPTSTWSGALPEAERPSFMSVWNVVPRPGHPRQFVLHANGMDHHFLFLVTLGAEWKSIANITLLHQVEQPPFSSSLPETPEFSADGRWLSIQDRDGIYLLEVESGQRLTVGLGETPGFFPVWSPDGEWVLLRREGYMLLLAPNTRRHHLIVHDFDYCYAATWLGDA